MPGDACAKFGRDGVPRGLALREAVTVIAVGGVLLALASVSMPRFRSGAMLEECIDNQREIAAGSGAFALANNDVFVGLTWLRGNQTSQYADLRAQATASGTAPHAAQVVDFWRRRGLTFFPPISAWFSDNLYWNTPLVEFLGRELTDPFTVCPGDAHQLAWRTDPTAFNNNAFLPIQPDASVVINRRWPYASSYLATAGAIDPYQSDASPTVVSNRLSQTGNTHATFNVPANNPYGPSPMSLVAHPSSKVFLFDFADWHFAQSPTYFALDGTTLPATFFDGSTRVVESDRANRPWVPSFPTSSSATSYTYAPTLWNPTGGLPPGTLPPPNGSTTVSDPFRYTRDGLLGIDFPPLSRTRRATTTRSQ